MGRNIRHKVIRSLKAVSPYLTLILVTFALRSAVADWNDIPTGSMKPTILEGDRVFVNKLAYDLKVPFTRHEIARWDDPERGDIVVFFSPVDGKRLVKRVIGLPEDAVEMRNNRLIINGKAAQYTPVDTDADDMASIGANQNDRLFQEYIPSKTHAVKTMPYRSSMKSFNEVNVPEGHYLMLGDNRDNSADSRYFGFVNRKLIVGRVTGVAFSLRRDEYFLPRWGRFCERLD